MPTRGCPDGHIDPVRYANSSRKKGFQPTEANISTAATILWVAPMRARPHLKDIPVSNWSKRTMQLSVGMIALGFLLVVMAWNGAAGVDSPEEQFPFLLSGGVIGLGLILSGLTLALVQEMRKAVGTISAKYDQMIEALGSGATGSVTGAGPTAVPTDGSHVVAGTTTYHLPDCRLIAERTDLQSMAPKSAVARGLAPCRICEPAEAAQAS